MSVCFRLADLLIATHLAHKDGLRVNDQVAPHFGAVRGGSLPQSCSASYLQTPR